MSTILQGRPAYNLRINNTQPSGHKDRTFNDDVSVLAQSRALHREGEGGTRCGLGSRKEAASQNLCAIDAWAQGRRGTNLLESLIMVLVVAHCCGYEEEIESKESGTRRES